mmetsp:Transcript_57754/g.116051  ORF Transcript_57754/g.116051 Transcript_57754/m.116051 type:complete len:190 (+) Transcript_57754:208-777(+)
MAFSIGFALCGDPKIVTKTYKDKVADKYEGLIEEKLCTFQPALVGGGWRKLKTVKEMNDLVLFYLLDGDGSAPGGSPFIQKKNGKPYEPSSLKNELGWIEWFFKTTWDSDFSFNDPVFKEHGSSRIALDMQMAKWRLKFKDTDYGIRPSSMPALLPQSHHLLDVPYLPSSTTSPKKVTGSSNEPRTKSG